MSAFTADERIALLLSVLGEDIAQPAVSSMNPTRGKFIQRLIDDYKSNPPTEEETDYVIGDFINFFEFAIHELTIPSESDQSSDAENEAEDESGNREGSNITIFPKVEPTSDPVADLNKLDPYQILQAIKDDHPKTLAMILERITPDKAGSILAELEDEQRNQVVAILSEGTTVPPLIVHNVLRSTFESAVKIRSKENKVDQTTLMAEMLRFVPKDLRNGMMDALEEANQEFSQAVKKQLYTFDDIGRLSDRDIQKLLGEIQTDFLIVGLQKASDKITDKILGNLSKRARESVLEEMQYKTNVTEEEIDGARAELIAVLARLDEAGEVTL